MIKAVAKFFVNQNKIEEFIKLSTELIENTRKENGCIKYELFEDSTKNTTFSIIEEWENMSVLEAHFKSEHFTRIIPQLELLVTQEIEVNIYKQII